MRVYAVLAMFLVSARAFQLGLAVPPSQLDSQGIMQSVRNYHEELYRLKKSSKKAKELQRMIDAQVSQYISNNLCVRYPLSEYTEDHTSQNTLVAMHVFVEDAHSVDEHGNKNQQLNLNVIDDEGNTIRRKNDISDARMAVSVPENLRKDAYFDICFENQLIDKSWRNTGSPKHVILEVEIGIPEILDNLEKSETALGPVQKQFEDIEQELSKLISQFKDQILPDETASRNFNEDLFSKVVKSGIIASVALVVVGGLQITWLIYYLKSNKLI